MAWTRLKLISNNNASTPIVSLDDTKQHCRIFTSDDDNYVAQLVSAATAVFDGPNGAGIPLLTQTWEATYPGLYQDTGLIIPMYPVQSINSVQYTAYDGSIQTLNTAIYDYDLDENPVSIVRAYAQSFPTVKPVKRAVIVNFTVGYGPDPSYVPVDIIHGIKLLVSHWYFNRDAVVGLASRDSPSEMPMGVQYILDKYRPLSYA